MAVTRDGRTLYVAAFGSSKVGVFDTAAAREQYLHAEHRQPDQGQRRRPDRPRARRGTRPAVRADSLRQFDLHCRHRSQARRSRPCRHVQSRAAEHQKGRRFLTTRRGRRATATLRARAAMSSAISTASPGISAIPDGTTFNHPGPFTLGPTIFSVPPNPHFRALKGPMTTQSLRGMANHGSMHWRGDRTGGNDEPSAQPDAGPFRRGRARSRSSTRHSPACSGGTRSSRPDEMQAFTDFILQVTYPPNPIRASTTR